MQNDLICRSAVIDRYYAEYEKQDICDGDEDRDWLKKCIEEAPDVDAVSRLVVEHIKWERDTAIQQLKDHGIPFGGTATDVVEVVRCKDCKHWNRDALACDTLPWVNSSEHVNWYENDFCSYGERRVDDDRDK